MSSQSSETYRAVDLTKIGDERYKATNARGGETFFGSGGEDPDFTPVEMFLASIAACTALNIDGIAGKRATAETFDIRFPEGEYGDAARAVLPRALEQSRDRLCTVSRTVEFGEPIELRLA